MTLNAIHGLKSVKWPHDDRVWPASHTEDTSTPLAVSMEPQDWAPGRRKSWTKKKKLLRILIRQPFSFSERFDPATNNWSSIREMCTPRSNFGIEIIDDMIFVIGGYDGVTTIDASEYLFVRAMKGELLAHGRAFAYSSIRSHYLIGCFLVQPNATARIRIAGSKQPAWITSDRRIRHLFSPDCRMSWITCTRIAWICWKSAVNTWLSGCKWHHSRGIEGNS